MKPARKAVRRTRKSADPTPKSEVIALPADCTLRNIAALRDRLCQLSEDTHYITLDLRQLTQFDTSTLQLVTAFARDQSVRGAHVLTCGNSAAWNEAARLLGLSTILNGQA